MNLDTIRQEIDHADQELVTLLEKRMQLVDQAVAYKKATGKPILDTSHEDAVLQKAASRVEDEVFEQTIVSTFADITKNSRDHQAKQLDNGLAWEV